MKRGFVGVTNIETRATLLFMVQVPCDALVARSRLLVVACLRPLRPLEIELRAQIDRNVDHLAVDGDGRHAALQPLGKDLSHLHVVSGFFGARTETLVARLDPRRMRTDRALEAGVSRAPDRLPQLLVTDVVLRQAQRVTHSLRLPADGGGNRDELGLDVLERLEFQPRLAVDIPRFLRELALVDREDAEPRTRAGDLQRIPDPGGGIDLDVYFERSGGDPPALLERVEALARVLDRPPASFTPFSTTPAIPGNTVDSSSAAARPGVDPDENLGAAPAPPRVWPQASGTSGLPASRGPASSTKSRMIASAHEA